MTDGYYKTCKEYKKNVVDQLDVSIFFSRYYLKVARSGEKTETNNRKTGPHYIVYSI